MTECFRCDENESLVRYWKSKAEDLEKKLIIEQTKTEDYESVKSDRDELQAAANKIYDNWATNPERFRDE